jgi:hypothetical protein
MLLDSFLKFYFSNSRKKKTHPLPNSAIVALGPIQSGPKFLIPSIGEIPPHVWSYLEQVKEIQITLKKVLGYTNCSSDLYGNWVDSLKI